jgi:hypothetical protein
MSARYRFWNYRKKNPWRQAKDFLRAVELLLWSCVSRGGRVVFSGRGESHGNRNHCYSGRNRACGKPAVRCTCSRTGASTTRAARTRLILIILPLRQRAACKKYGRNQNSQRFLHFLLQYQSRKLPNLKKSRKCEGKFE